MAKVHTVRKSAPVAAPAPAASEVVTIPAAEVAALQKVVARVVSAPAPSGQGSVRMLASPTIGTVVAAPNVLNRAGSLHSAVPSAIAGVKFVMGKVPKVRVPYTLAALEAMAKVTSKGPATSEVLAAASTTDFVRYSIRRGWLVKAPA